jgi:hypothetical protein
MRASAQLPNSCVPGGAGIAKLVYCREVRLPKLNEALVGPVAFDCQIGVGKGSWRRTVIAVEIGSDLSLLLNPEMRIDSSGRWKVLYRPRASINFRVTGLMPPEELESYLNSVAAGAPKSSQ